MTGSCALHNPFYFGWRGTLVRRYREEWTEVWFVGVVSRMLRTPGRNRTKTRTQPSQFCGDATCFNHAVKNTRIEWDIGDDFQWGYNLKRPYFHPYRRKRGTRRQSALCLCPLHGLHCSVYPQPLFMSGAQLLSLRHI